VALTEKMGQPMWTPQMSIDFKFNHRPTLTNYPITIQLITNTHNILVPRFRDFLRFFLTPTLQCDNHISKILRRLEGGR
jgi:hypothetical protein